MSYCNISNKNMCLMFDKFSAKCLTKISFKIERSSEKEQVEKMRLLNWLKCTAISAFMR